MSLKEVERLLTLVEGSLRCTPRNAYEAQNNFHTSIDRLTTVRKILPGFSGDYVDALYKRTDQLERRVNETAGQIGSSQKKPADRGAFALDADFAHSTIVDDNEFESGFDEEVRAGRPTRGGAERRKATKKPKPPTKVADTTSSETPDIHEGEYILTEDATRDASSTRAKKSNRSKMRGGNKHNTIRDDAQTEAQEQATRSTSESAATCDHQTSSRTERADVEEDDGVARDGHDATHSRAGKDDTRNVNTVAPETASTGRSGTGRRAGRSVSHEDSRASGGSSLLLRQSIHTRGVLPTFFFEDVCSDEEGGVAHGNSRRPGAAPLSHTACMGAWRGRALDGSAARVGTCAVIAGTALVRVELDTAVHRPDDTLVTRLELYRCVLLALTYGTPVVPPSLPHPSSAPSAAAMPAQGAWKNHGEGGDRGCVVHTTSSPSRAPGTSDRSSSRAQTNGCEDVVLSKQKQVAEVSNHHNSAGGGGGSCDRVDTEAREGAVVLVGEDEDDERGAVDDVEELSRQLIAEYDAAQAFAEEEETFGEVPRTVSVALCRAICTSSQRTWVILLCHGGCFAGGVYVGGRCVVHKSFQRYVVRKKQGGKQSSHNDGGSFHSAGSLIRAGQELKWRLTVREVLLEWRTHIEAALVILYAAPGPQNRAILTDFSALPASTVTGNSVGVDSPVRMSDARVCGVPFTTHKPTYKEVERVYTLVSDVTVVSTPVT